MSTSPGFDAALARARCPSIAGRAVRWIVPFSPGGGYDVYARLLEPFLERELDVAIAVDNRPGAAGLVGARALRGARPDGLTLGILNATGLLLASWDDPELALDPAEDFTILGRVARTPNIWAASRRSGIRSIADVLSIAAARPVVVGVTEISSNNFVSAAVGAHLLGVELEYVAGFAGTRESSLALLRGDVDLASFTFGSVRDRIEGGDLVPILQVAARPIDAHASLRDVPLLAGPAGLASRRASELGRDSAGATATAEALTAFLGAGRVVAAPPGLPPALTSCFDRALQRVMTSAEFVAATTRAARPVDGATAAEAAAEIRAAATAAPRLIDIVRASIRRIRG